MVAQKRLVAVESLNRRSPILDSRLRGNDKGTCPPEADRGLGCPMVLHWCHCEERSDEAISGWRHEARRTRGLPRLLLARIGEWLAMTGWRGMGARGLIVSVRRPLQADEAVNDGSID